MSLPFEPASVALWSLKMRWWAFRRDLADGLVSPDVQMFVLYHGVNGLGEMGISVGMRKGRYGIVKAVARESSQPRNLVVFTLPVMFNESAESIPENAPADRDLELWEDAAGEPADADWRLTVGEAEDRVDDAVWQRGLCDYLAEEEATSLLAEQDLDTLAHGVGDELADNGV